MDHALDRRVDSAVESVHEFIRAGEQKYPGVTDLLRAYGGYEEYLRVFQWYTQATKVAPIITTSNSSTP